MIMDMSDSVGPCKTCKSTKYSQTNSGFLVCEYGHQSKEFWLEEQEEFDASINLGRVLGRKRVKVFKSSSNETGEEAGKLRFGEVHKYNFYLGLQYVLQSQTVALRTFLKLGLELDDHVRRIWLTFVTTIGMEYDEESFVNNEPFDTTNENPIEHEHGEGEGEGEGEETFSKSSPEIFGETIKDQINKIIQAHGRELPAIDPANYLSPAPQNVLRRIGPSTLLVILYFGLIQLGVPILLADIKRLVLKGIIPLVKPDFLLPPELRRTIKTSKWEIALSGGSGNYPSTLSLTRVARIIAYQLAVKGGLVLWPSNVDGLVLRFVEELSLPNCFAPMIRTLINKYGVATSYFGLQVERSYSPELVIMAGVIYFLKLHYGFDVPRRGDKARETFFQRIGLPSGEQLLSLWKGKQSRIVLFDKIPGKDHFLWKDLDGLLLFCDSIGVRTAPNRLLNLKPGSYDELQVYPDPPPVWKDLELDQTKISKLIQLPKIWTVSTVEEYEELVDSYQLLLSVASTIIDFQPDYLFKRVCCTYEQRLPIFDRLETET